MIFACPPEGFRVVVDENLNARIDGFAERWSRFQGVFQSSLERLRKTAHKEGTLIRSEAGAVFGWETVFRSDGQDLLLTLVYRCRGDTLTIHSLVIFEC